MYRLYGSQILRRLRERFERLYGNAADLCLKRVIMMVGRYGQGIEAPGPGPLWDQTDALLITYPDMLNTLGERPLRTLHRFLRERLRDSFSIVHILPFFPFSADDGFAIEDFRNVRPGLGDWDDIHRIGEDFSLMFDLVLNHVSRHHPWIKDYLEGIAPARDFFIETDPTEDLSLVVRPRSTPLLTRLPTNRGARYLWTTFGSQQIDLNFANPDVLFEFLDLLLHYVRHGARIIRLDAVAYVWKKPGTACIHLPETHELVRLFRDFLGICAPRTILLTETNVPQRENLSYFGEGDEAHMVYQFSLPPLLLHGLLRGSAR
ncbi:MAG TPA: alpha-amylase, partial [Kiritimatiellae bacterium]|nr:alpha-amylase [Kiritimatiellia bacterium]